MKICYDNYSWDCQVFKTFIRQSLNHHEICRHGPLHTKMLKKATPMHANQILLSLNHWPIVGRSKIPIFFHTQFQMESNHYEIKTHFQTFDN